MLNQINTTFDFNVLCLCTRAVGCLKEIISRPYSFALFPRPSQHSSSAINLLNFERARQIKTLHPTPVSLLPHHRLLQLPRHPQMFQEFLTYFMLGPRITLAVSVRMPLMPIT